MSFKTDFDAAVARNPEDLAGEYTVCLVASYLPGPVRFLGHKKVFERTADGITGYNAFLGGRVKTGHFRVERGTADDGSEVTRIIYDSPRNPFFMRPLTDEVRETAPGSFLGRGMMKIAGKARNVFWFTVTKE